MPPYLHSVRGLLKVFAECRILYNDWLPSHRDLKGSPTERDCVLVKIILLIIKKYIQKVRISFNINNSIMF